MRSMLSSVMLLSFCLLIYSLILFSGTLCAAEKPASIVFEPNPILIGYDAETGHRTSTSDDAIIIGISVAIEEINTFGGVLDGRPLKLVVKDNRSVPARGVKNIREFAEMKDLVAVVGGKFSPVQIAEVDILHEKEMILLDVWAAADEITENGKSPNYCFRISLMDSWATELMLNTARQYGYKRVGVLLPVTGWGRSNESAILRYLAQNQDMKVTDTQWYHWGDKSLLEPYQHILDSGAQALILVANEAEGSILVREMAELPAQKRLPILSHWGISGGAFTNLTGAAIEQVDLSLVQTYSFFDNYRPDVLKRFYRTAEKLFNISRPEDIPSPVGVAHAYDAVHLLVRAIERAGSTDRRAIRAALEGPLEYDGLLRHYEHPFSAKNHNALSPSDLFMGRFRFKDGAILRIGH